MGAVSRSEVPREQILGVFDAFVDRAKESDYHGCAFARACAEAPAGPNAARDVTAAHRAWRHEFFARLAKEAGMRDPAATASQLGIIYDGAACSVSLDGDPGAVAMARLAVERLLDQQAGPSTRRKTSKTPAKRASRASR